MSGLLIGLSGTKDGIRNMIKSRALACAILSLFVYLAQNVLSSLLVGTFSVSNFESMLISSLIALCFLILLIRNKERAKYYGICSLETGKEMLLCLPLFLVPMINLLYILSPDAVGRGIATSIVAAVFTGIVEELIFRGFLFRAIEERTTPMRAIIVSSIIFGLFHFVNMTAWSIEFVVLQVINATAIGISFAIIFHITRSILPCIIIHVLTNIFGVFFVEEMMLEIEFIGMVILILIAVFYSIMFHKHRKVR